MTYRAELFAIGSDRLMQLSCEEVRSNIIIPRYLGALAFRSSAYEQARNARSEAGFIIPQTKDFEKIGLSSSIDIPYHGDTMAVHADDESERFVAGAVLLGREQVDAGYDHVVGIPLDNALSQHDVGLATLRKVVRQAKLPFHRRQRSR